MTPYLTNYTDNLHSVCMSESITTNSVTFTVYPKLSFDKEKGHIYKDCLALDVPAYLSRPEVFNWQW